MHESCSPSRASGAGGAIGAAGAFAAWGEPHFGHISITRYFACVCMRSIKIWRTILQWPMAYNDFDMFGRIYSSFVKSGSSFCPILDRQTSGLLPSSPRATGGLYGTVWVNRQHPQPEMLLRKGTAGSSSSARVERHKPHLRERPGQLKCQWQASQAIIFGENTNRTYQNDEEPGFTS